MSAHKTTGVTGVADLGAEQLSQMIKGYWASQVFGTAACLKSSYSRACGRGAGAQAPLAQRGLSSRCRAIEGNFFDIVPEADLYILKSIDHHITFTRLKSLRPRLPP